MKRLIRGALVVTLAVCGLAMLAPSAASAHPLGNYSVNHYDQVILGVEQANVLHVIDLAEVPTVQSRAQWDGRLTEYGAALCSETAADLKLTVAGPLCRWPSTAVQPEPCRVRLVCPRCASSAGCPAHTSRSLMAREATFVDDAFATDVGWREIVVAGDGVRVDADVPSTSVSDALTRYPDDLLSSPLDVRSATATVVPDASVEASGGDVVAETVERGRAGPLSGAFERAVTASTGLLAGIVAVALAMLVGATHALAPGHGKTVMALALTGRQGTVRDAAAVGLGVTVTHTAGVLVLGVLVAAGSTLVPAHVTQWLVVAGGALVVAVGLFLLRDVRRGGHHHHGHGRTAHTGTITVTAMHRDFVHDHGQSDAYSHGPDFAHDHELIRVGGHDHTATTVPRLTLR